MREGGGGAKRSKGFKPLLRQRIFLDFLGICSIDIVSIISIFRLIIETELWGLLTFKKETKMSKKLIIFVALLLCGIPNIVSLSFNFAPFGSELQGRRQDSEFLELSNYAFAQSVDTAWVRRYNGPGNLVDEARAMAVEGSGNVYVTGHSYGGASDYDYATIKYYPNGDTAWVRRYNGPGDSTDLATGIVVDMSGNVYVTGVSYGSGTGKDYATIKYFPNGDTAWVRRYGWWANGDDGANGITIDKSGNIYVTGYIYDTDASNACATIKYLPTGTIAWVGIYLEWDNADEAGGRITVDGFGNVYVAGGKYITSRDWDFLTIKYFSSGYFNWATGYNGPGDSVDFAHAICVDDSMNVYVTGGSYGGDPAFGGTHWDFATVKYNPNGDTAWVRRYDGPVSDWDEAWDIALDGSNNIYVTGRSAGWTYWDYTTIKYYPNGDTAWVRRYNGPDNSSDGALAIATDGSGNIYVTGSSSGIGTYQDCATVSYDSLGNQRWVQRYNGPGNSNDGANAIAVDGSGNVYVTGWSTGSGTDYDYATIKYIQFLRGDANHDGIVNVSDVVYLISYLFKGGPAPIPGTIVGDANCDGKVTIADAVYLINYLFKGGPKPCI